MALPGGGNISQNPSKFSSSDKTSDHFQPNTASGSAVASMPDRPDKDSARKYNKDRISRR